MSEAFFKDSLDQLELLSGVAEFGLEVDANSEEEHVPDARDDDDLILDLNDLVLEEDLGARLLVLELQKADVVAVDPQCGYALDVFFVQLWAGRDNDAFGVAEEGIEDFREDFSDFRQKIIKLFRLEHQQIKFN